MPSIAERKDVYTLITDRIIGLLEQGVAPWQKPWAIEAGQPRNLISKKDYRGVNTWLLGAQGYSSPFWLTFNQAKALGGNVRKGEKSTPIVFWKIYDKENDDGEKDKRFVLRYFSVFNSAQVDGIKIPEIATTQRTHTPIEVCEKIVGNYPLAPSIFHGGAQAFYRPSADEVHMPNPESFGQVQRYYSTLFHELTHSTGHKSRLDRSTLKDMVRFGDQSYAQEEMVAESGAAFLCAVAGIDNTTIDQSASYIAGWIKVLKNDTKMLIRAASQAQKAADHILNVKATETTEE